MTNVADNMAVVETYMEAMTAKDFTAMEACLHPDVHFLMPGTEVTGRSELMALAREFADTSTGSTTVNMIGSGNQVMIVYNVEYAKAIEPLRTAALITVEQGLITDEELFYDQRVPMAS